MRRGNMGRGATGRLRPQVGEKNKFHGAGRLELFLVQFNDSKGRQASQLGARLGREQIFLLPAELFEKALIPNDELRGKILASLDGKATVAGPVPVPSHVPPPSTMSVVDVPDLPLDLEVR